MKIVTVCSHTDLPPYYRPDAFFASCKRFGIEPIVLGRNGAYKGLGSKVRLLKELLDSPQVFDDKRMIFCDAFDVVFQKNPILCQHFLDLGPKLIFNAERALFPFDQEVFQGHPLSETSYRFLNSGFIVGQTETFRKALELMNADKVPDDHQMPDKSWVNPNDQELWQKLFVAERKTLGLALDTRAELCLTLSNTVPEELDFDGPLISSKETGSAPICLHLNGAKELWWPAVLEKLKLP